MEQELYKAIIHNALKDLFSQKTDEDKRYREEAYAWFNYEGPAYEETGVTFIDACDLADYNFKQWKYVAYLIYTEKLTKKDYLELMAVEEVVRPAKHAMMLNYPELPFSPLVGAIRKFHSIEEANLYNATL